MKIIQEHSTSGFFHSVFRFVARLTTSRSIVCSMHLLDILFAETVLLCALSNVLKPIACRADADSEREGIFSGCLASVRF